MIFVKPTFKVFIIFWVIADLILMIGILYPYQVKNVKEAYFEDTKLMKVEETTTYHLFNPTTETNKVFIFYPGTLVAPEAYVPLCRQIADHNIKVYLIKMPWRLAFTGYNLPKDLNLFSDTTKTYVLSGHSQGAKMAAQFVLENPTLIDKLVLIGSIHPQDISLASIHIPVLKIYGSNDGIAAEKSIVKNKEKLPLETTYIRLQGANHSQFGYYGSQLGDNDPGISREVQQAETLKHILKFIN